MNISTRSIAFLLAALALPGAALAQQPSAGDVAYCQAMADLYRPTSR